MIAVKEVDLNVSSSVGGSRVDDPAIDRWLTPDKTDYAGGNNLYDYGDDDPINKNDPQGTSSGRAEEDYITGSYYGKMDEIGNNPWNLANPLSRYFVPTIVVRSVFWDGPGFIGRGVRVAFAEAKGGLSGAAQSAPAGSIDRAAMRTAQGFVYAAEPITYGSYLYSQGAPLGPVASLKYIRPTLPYITGALAMGQAYQMSNAPAGSLQMEDWMDLGALSLGTWYLTEGAKGPLNPLNYKWNVGGVVDGQVSVGANRFFVRQDAARLKGQLTFDSAFKKWSDFVDQNVGPAKTGPSTDPNTPHNAMIAQIEATLPAGDRLIAGGSRPERLIRTPGGYVSGRRPDLLVQRPNGSMYGINVGLVELDGFPVTREAEALYDLRQKAGLETYYIPYGVKK